MNHLRLPFFRNRNDPLEDFDYSGFRSNPIRQPSAARTPSTYAHKPASCVPNNHFFNVSLVVASAEEQENDIRTATEEDQQQFRNLFIVIQFRSGGSISCLNTQHDT
ncbi:Regulator of nonsense transcripts-like protein [Dorcoceras hygrometricum]|uniref:Regulator of nonsense transcripts-like protein n=1 Tax=Dorcoceras hygrometricum TaxID=472368 RepID=A0A2Z7B402_9LAMI|nr:Regulator of nonsense transcripts-like protein [Dorcoceras hygrometricum]